MPHRTGGQWDGDSKGSQSVMQMMKLVRAEQHLLCFSPHMNRC